MSIEIFGKSARRAKNIFLSFYQSATLPNAGLTTLTIMSLF